MNLKIYFVAFFISLSILIEPVRMSEAYELIKQFYECRHLQMHLSIDWRGRFYTLNDSIPNNTLNDTFYHGLGLSNMTFTQGMDFIRQFYTTTRNCRTFQCNCTSWGLIDTYANYSLFFRNSSNFIGMKSIIWAFNNKYKSALSLNQSLMHYGTTYPTLVRFMMIFEYTWAKVNLYKVSLYCATTSFNWSVRLMGFKFKFMSVKS